MGRKKKKVQEDDGRKKVTAPKRIQKELEYIQEEFQLKSFRFLRADEENIRNWTALILPDNELYSEGAFRITILFPKDYPFEPPRVTFITKIYHPNVDRLGQVCLPMINSELWKPTTRIDQVIQGLIALINSPDPDDPIDLGVAQEYIYDYPKFKSLALSYTRKFAEPRPPEEKKKKKKPLPGQQQKRK